MPKTRRVGPRVACSAGCFHQIVIPYVLKTPAARKGDGQSFFEWYRTIHTRHVLPYGISVGWPDCAFGLGAERIFKTPKVWQARASAAVPDKRTTTLYYLATTESGGCSARCRSFPN